MNLYKLKQLKDISDRFKYINKKIKEYIKRQDILDFIENRKKHKYSNFNINESSYTFSQFFNSDMFQVEEELGKINIRSYFITAKEEYNLEFIGNKIIVKNITNSKTKLSYTEKIYEYENDILIRETEKIIDKTDNNIISENEAIYDYKMKLLLRKNKNIVMNDLNKKEKVEYEATSFIEGINFDSKKNSNSNYSYLNLHLPFVDITKEAYENAQKRLFKEEKQEKQKLLNKD